MTNVSVVALTESTGELVERARRAGDTNRRNVPAETVATIANKDTENVREKRRKRPAEVTVSPTEESLSSYKIPKKPNSVIFPREVRPDWLKEDEQINELTRGEAAHAISQWNMTSALIKQNELKEEKANKTKGSLKKDQEVKTVKVEAGEDNASSSLHKQHFMFRTPLLKPESYWQMYPVKWPETNKRVHLAHLGLDHVISAKTLEMIHDRSDMNIEIKKFSNVNVMINREGSHKTSRVQQMGDSIEVESKDTWLDMANISQLEEAMDNLVRIWTVMWPGDYGPANLRGVITKHRCFASGFDNLDTRKKVLEDFANKVLQDNAVRAGQELPPLSFKEIDERAKDVLDRKTEFNKARGQNYRGNNVNNVNNNRTVVNRSQNNQTRSSAQNANFEKMRLELMGKSVNGKGICAWYNMPEGCQTRRCLRAHVCGKVPSGKKEICGERHSSATCPKNDQFYIDSHL